MEEEMKDWYSRNASVLQIQSPKVGQVVAALAEEDAWLRAKIISTEGNRIKASAKSVCTENYITMDGGPKFHSNQSFYCYSPHRCF